MLCNYHFHDRNSFDNPSNNYLEDNIKEALKHGIHHFGVSNHPDNVLGNGLLDWGKVEISEAIARFTKGREECLQLREKYPQISLAYGYESNLEPHYYPLQQAIEQIVPFDFIIGSLHTVDGNDIASPNTSLFAAMSYKDAIHSYFEIMLQELPKSNCTHIGHIDLFKRFGAGYYGKRWDITPHTALLQKLAQVMVDKNIGVELNCSGLFSTAKEIFPSPELIGFLKDNGVTRFTLGSDAHNSRDFARGLREGEKLLQTFGIMPFTYSYSSRTL